MNIEEFYKKAQPIDESHYSKIKIEKIKALIPKNKKILDYGCGDGTITKLMAKENKVIGLDISKHSVELCREKGLDSRLIKPNQKLVFPDNHFDYVFLLETLEHVFDTEALLKELHRVLKQDGFFVVSIPNVAQLSNRVRFLFDLKLHYVENKIEAGHIRFFSLNSLKKLLEENGFKVLEVKASYVFVPFLNFYYYGDFFCGLGTELIFKARRR